MLCRPGPTYTPYKAPEAANGYCAGGGKTGAKVWKALGEDGEMNRRGVVAVVFNPPLTVGPLVAEIPAPVQGV